MAEGSLGGQKIRKALDLTSWEAASELVMAWEARGKISGHVVTVADAVSKFMDDARARHLTDASLAKYSVVLEKQLVPWCENRGLRYLSHLDVQNVAEFRASWKDGAVAAAKKLERLRTFFRFAEDRQWMESNPAKLIRPPKVTLKPTLPFSKDEMERILGACEKYPRKNSLGQDNRARIRAFVLLLRFSGLRLQDAVSLRKDRIKDNKLFLYTQKTGTPVFIPLPVAVVAALTSIRSASDDLLGNVLPFQKQA
jgi:site-specific recombinase XerD